MDKNKNKDIIYKLAGVVAILWLGEGVFGWAVYWVGLWFLLDWRYVYWLAFILGFLLVGLTGLEIGWVNLVLVAGVWLMGLLKERVGGGAWSDVIIVIVVAWLGNLMLGLRFSITEMILLGLLMITLRLWGRQGRDIRV